MRRRVAALLCVLPLAFGCATRSAPPPPGPPALARAVDALPADLDLVVRIDLSRVRAALGPEVVTQLRRAAELSAGKDGTEALVTAALEKTDVLLLGMRPRAAAALDHVLILEGDFEGFDPAAVRTEPGWHGGRDLGGEFRRWDRRAPLSRGAPALAYAKGERLIVLATPAEIDSTERAVEQGASEGALAPPSKGVVSFAARVLPLSLAIEPKAPTVARLLRAAERLEGSAELDNDAVRLELALKVDSAETAEQLQKLLQALADLLSLKRSFADLASSAKFEIAGEYVVCRIAVPSRTIAQWLACSEGGSGCPW